MAEIKKTATTNRPFSPLFEIVSFDVLGCLLKRLIAMSPLFVFYFLAGVIIANQYPRLSKSFQIRNIRNLAQASLVTASGAFFLLLVFSSFQQLAVRWAEQIYQHNTRHNQEQPQNYGPRHRLF
ncbi:hypothetical protein N9X93_04340 [Alphaproteobacteria bacterium]|nr:hypothetical protein [Alphaproteobacteria bacterium]